MKFRSAGFGSNADDDQSSFNREMNYSNLCDSNKLYNNVNVDESKDPGDDNECVQK